MWKAPEEVRLRRAVDWLVTHVPGIWHMAESAEALKEATQRLDSVRAEKLDEPHRSYYQATIDGLAREFGAEALPQLIPELYFFPADALSRDDPQNYDIEHWLPRALALHTLRMWVQSHAPDYAVELAAGRLRSIVTAGLTRCEQVAPFGHYYFFAPDATRCASLLDEWSDRPAAAAAIRELLDGGWDVPLEIPEAIRESWTKGGQAHLIDTYAGKGTYAYFPLSSLLQQGLLRLAARGELTLARLHDLSRREPHAVPVHVADRTHEPKEAGEREAAPIITEFLWQSAQKLDEHALRLADCYHFTGLTGGRWVVKACEHVETLGVTSVTAEGYDTLPRTLRWLADAHISAGETIEGLTVELRKFKLETIRMLLPHAPATEEAFLLVLGWEAALPLLRLTRRIATRQHETAYDTTPDAPNSPDPESGVVDRREIAAALDAAGPKLARDILAALRAGRVDVDNTTKLIEAVGGWNRKQVEKGLASLGQINLKALGLLPLERGEDEVVERYRLLRQAARDCRKFGPERQTNTRAAVAAGLANLAQTAGYDDVSRMEWAMEARIAEAAAPRAKIGEYEVAIAMPDLEPCITVRRVDRALATVPPAVRKAKEYAVLRETVAELKAQVARFRRTLEGMMIEGKPFAAADLAHAARLPTLQKLLAQLVLRRPDGGCGLLTDGVLVGAEGEPLSLVDGIQVAHPVQLIGDAALRTWQNVIVARRIVQPFKQVFREVYTLTEAERASEGTARFAGHQLDGRVVRRLLQSRGWEVEPGDCPLPFRRYRSAGLRVWFDFPEARHFIGDDEPLESGGVSFTTEGSREGWQAPERVLLQRVPSVLVSEALRDADLIVSVARAGDDKFSAEAYTSRGETVVALAGLLGVADVECDGRFVRVRGKLARYRVHLGSATVLVEPANAVCILPEPKRKKTDGMWLPFAEEDERLAEVVSKVVLLAADDAIKDRGMLAQIKAASLAG